MLRKAAPKPPQVSFDKIQPGNSCLEETGLNDAYFDAKVVHVPPVWKSPIIMFIFCMKFFIKKVMLVFNGA